MLRSPDVDNGAPVRARFGRHVARLGVATGLALTAVAAVAPHVAAADTRADRGADTVTLSASESNRDALPHTGDGTIPVMLAGAGSLAIGGLALWFGGRRQSPRTNPRH